MGDMKDAVDTRVTTRCPLNALPAEIWEDIFRLACMDGGPTSCALNLVSKQVRYLALPSRFRSLCLLRRSAVLQIAPLLESVPDYLRRVEYLYISTPYPGTVELKDEDDLSYHESSDEEGSSDDMDTAEGGNDADLASNPPSSDTNASSASPESIMGAKLDLSTSVHFDSEQVLPFANASPTPSDSDDISISSDHYEHLPVTSSETRQLQSDLAYFESPRGQPRVGPFPGPFLPHEYEIRAQELTLGAVRKILSLVYTSLRHLTLQVTVFKLHGDSSLAFDQPFPRLRELDSNLDIKFPLSEPVSSSSDLMTMGGLGQDDEDLDIDDPHVILPCLQQFVVRVIDTGVLADQVRECIRVAPRLRRLKIYVAEEDEDDISPMTVLESLVPALKTCRAEKGGALRYYLQCQEQGNWITVMIPPFGTSSALGVHKWVQVYSLDEPDEPVEKWNKGWIPVDER